MIGLGIVIVYILAAIFAPLLTPYNPMKDFYLADRMAAPSWAGSVMSRFRGAPPTFKRVIGARDWHVEEETDARLSGTQIEGEHMTVVELTPPEDDPFEQARLVSSYVIHYPYNPPQTFDIKFEYSIEAPDDASTQLRIEFEAPDGSRRNLWRSSAWGSSDVREVTLDARDLDFKMNLGMGLFDDPATVLFSKQGDYRLVFTASATGSGPVAVRMSPMTFGVLGLLHGPLGADHMGADLWAQLVYGARLALLIGLSAALIAVAIGTSVGIISGYVGGAVDEILMRVVDVLLAIPTLPILIVLGAFLGKSVWNIVILVAAFAWMGTARLVRSQTLSLKERTFVEAARAGGASAFYIMTSHILPNVLPLVFAALVLRIPAAILMEAALSFLGLGDPSVPTWGRMLQNARSFGAFTTLAWWWLIPPGISLTFLSLAFVFIGNTVNEIFNPRYRERS
jgi:peptide/nickel transport system permease protein